jgi:hypothetical protein
MGRLALALFLVFLLFFAIADDLFASFTADPGDDALAAANNVYLSGQATHDLQRVHASPLPSLDGLAPALLGPRPAALLGERPAGFTAAPLTGADPLYRLMSLQR